MNTELLSGLVITNVLSVSTRYNPEGAGNHRVNRQMWAIIIKYEGETVYTSNGNKYVSNATHATLLPKGCSYDWICTKAGHYSAIEFESPQTSEEIVTFRLSNPEKLLGAIKKLELKKTLKKEFFRLECIKEAYYILLELLKENDAKYKPQSKLRKITPALEYIAQNYSNEVGNDFLASLCGISTVYFRKLFAEITGKSPIAYIQDLKAEKAKEMLKSDYGSIGDIAYELGYKSIYDFSRAFKKVVGVSPKKYKESTEN